MELETNRLILRDYMATDWERVHIYGSSEEFCQFDVWGPNTIEDTQNFIHQAQLKAQHEPRYEFELAVILKSEQSLIGGVGLRRDWQDCHFGNFGYAINPAYQKQGYATEAARKLIQFGFEELKLAVIYATCDVLNEASFRVMEKLGMERVGHVKNHKQFKGRIRDSYCYELLHPSLGNPNLNG